ncbi:MAG: DUF4394 domain-containing protein [Acidobacteriota bacterium]|nr:DUF4394 domain-containing protein [Acidobacteriota bacterium]
MTTLKSIKITEVDGERSLASLKDDITERKQVEDALWESEAKYRSLIESLPLIVYVAAPHPPYSPIYISQSVEILGYSLDEWFSRADLWVSLLHPEDREWVLRDTEAVMAARRENDYEYRIVGRDGGVRWVCDRGRFVVDETGEPFCWQGVIIDITERKRAEERLAAMHRQLEKSHDDMLSTLDQLHLGVVMMDEGGRVTFMSRAYPGPPPVTATGVTGAAYTNNDSDANTATTLYNIDSIMDQVNIQSPANSGQLAATGKLTVDTTPTIGFDIYSTIRNGSTVDLRGLASLTTGGQTRLYRITLFTGKATLRGTFSSQKQFTGIAIPLNQL